ncbi:hypothetical protein EXX81_21870 [Escherichia coli]|nr:hypothetical protein EXX81_21870 [Escherichia coli]
MVCVVGRMRDLILQLSKSSIYSTKPHVPFHLYSSYFKLHVLRLELFRVYKYKNQEMADESRARKKELILERSAKSH